MPRDGDAKPGQVAEIKKTSKQRFHQLGKACIEDDVPDAAYLRASLTRAEIKDAYKAVGGDWAKLQTLKKRYGRLLAEHLRLDDLEQMPEVNAAVEQAVKLAL